jgi:hypothetical protein
MSQINSDVADVTSGLDAICELLDAANDAKVHAGGVRALLKPLQAKIAGVACDLADYPCCDDGPAAGTS